jgi:hypothetical protein
MNRDSAADDGRSVPLTRSFPRVCKGRTQVGGSSCSCEERTMAKNQNNNATNEPWRAGRPSFKAFYPEIFLLTLVTIAFIALAFRFSCSEIRKSREKASGGGAADAVTFDAPLFTSLAFAQDVDIADVADSSDADAKKSAPKAASDADSESAAAPDPAPKDSAPAKEKSAFPWGKIMWIWIICLLVPLILWVWRGCCWIYAVFGIRYELRVDPDNPRATTFLTTRGIFNKTTDSMHIGAIKDIRSLQSFVQKYFMGGVGTIALFTSDLTDGSLEMKNMAEPSRVFNSLDTLRRHYWSRGGMQLHSGEDAMTEDEDGAFNEELPH